MMDQYSNSSLVAIAEEILGKTVSPGVWPQNVQSGFLVDFHPVDDDLWTIDAKLTLDLHHKVGDTWGVNFDEKRSRH